MAKFELPKFIERWKNNLILISILILLSIGLIYLTGILIGVWHEHSKAFTKMIKEREEYNQFILRQKELPSNKLIKEYEDHANELKKSYREIYDIMRPKEKKVISVPALEFKQHLLAVQRNFQAKSEEKNIPIPVELGFKELLGNKIPSDKAIPLISMQLNLISRFLDMLFQSQVERIETIVKKSAIKDKRFKRKLPFSITFKAEDKSLVTLLNLLQSQNDIFIVENLNIDALPLSKFREEKNLGNLLEVSMDIIYLELKKL